MSKTVESLLKEALDLFSHEFCHADGSVIESPGGPSVGAQWVVQARAALAAARRGRRRAAPAPAQEATSE